jgi:UPF0042 nucleotide-binding protein
MDACQIIAALTAISDRIEAVFEEDTDRHYALEQAGMNIDALVSRLTSATPVTAGAVEITTFGYLHREVPPPATITLDLRTHFKDPHVNPALRHMTAHDAPVREAVVNTSGIPALITATVSAVLAYLAGPTDAPVTVAVGCAGGRHRAATVGMALAGALADHGITTTVTHLDLSRPVVDR